MKLYILKNATTNIWSSKGRNILIGIIIFVIAVSSCVALSIKQAAIKAEKNGLNLLSITANIFPDREKIRAEFDKQGGDFREMMRSVQSLSIDELKKYSTSKSVSDFRYIITTSANVNGITPINQLDTSKDTTNQKDNSESRHQINYMEDIRRSQGDFLFIGFNSFSAMTDFASGTSKITSGQMFNIQNNECIISADLAKLNSKKVGDSIEVTNPNNQGAFAKLKIVGIYDRVNTEAQKDGNFPTLSDPANQIYTPFNFLNNFVSSINSQSDDSTKMNSDIAATYVFSDKKAFDNFKTDVKKLGLSDKYVIRSNDYDSYNESTKPLRNTVDFANTMLILVLVIGGIILIILNIFNIRERKYEVGVLTAIGMKKSKVALQFVTELLIVTFIAVIIGTAVGTVVSVPASNSLLKTQITAQENKVKEQMENFGPGGNFKGGQDSRFRGLPGFRGASNQKVDYISTINATTNFNVVGQLMGIGFLLTLLSSLSAVVFIMRYEPLKILSERT